MILLKAREILEISPPEAMSASGFREDPLFAEYAVLKPGPLSQDNAYLKEIAGVYSRGLMEVDQWIRYSLEKENAD